MINNQKNSADYSYKALWPPGTGRATVTNIITN